MKFNLIIRKRGLLLWSLWVCGCAGAAASLPVETDTLEKKHINSVYMPDSVVLPKPPQWELEWATQYMDQVVFSGRDYRIQQFAAIPRVSLKHSSGFWVSAIGYYLSSVSSLKEQPISKRDFVVGFQRAVTDWWGTSIAYGNWKYFGRSQSELRYTFDYLISNYNSVRWAGITFTPQFYAMVGHQNKSKVFQMGLGLTKYFEKRFPKDKYGVWSMEPDFTVMTSTSSSDGRYEPPTWFEGKKLEIVSCELIIPVTYRSDIYISNKKWGQIAITPRWHFVKAINAAPNDGAKRNPFSYWTAEVKYTLNR
jgi:hypothetical protein